MTLLDENALRERLRDACKQAGSAAEWGKQHGIVHSYVYEVLRGVKRPGRNITDALGYERVVGYRQKAQPVEPCEIGK